MWIGEEAHTDDERDGVKELPYGKQRVGEMIRIYEKLKLRRAGGVQEINTKDSRKRQMCIGDGLFKGQTHRLPTESAISRITQTPIKNLAMAQSFS